MEEYPKREILARIEKLTLLLTYEKWEEANNLLAKLRLLLGKATAELEFSEVECQLLVDACSLLNLHRAYYPSLLKLIKVGCSCNEQIALLEQSCELSMERQVLAETLERLENLSPHEIRIFIDGKETLATRGVLSESDFVLIERAEQLAMQHD